jgi:uncharacterized membrane protein
MCCVFLTGQVRSWLKRSFIAAAVAWVLVLPLAAFAASRPVEASRSHLAAVIPYAIGAVICHQLSSRSFHLWSHQLPVCARCTGIYVGAALIALAAAFRTAQAVRHNNPENVAQGLSPAKTLLLAAVPTLATLAYEWTTGAPPSNIIRALAGLPLGAAVASVVLAAADDQVN